MVHSKKKPAGFYERFFPFSKNFFSHYHIFSSAFKLRKEPHFRLKFTIVHFCAKIPISKYSRFYPNWTIFTRRVNCFGGLHPWNFPLNFIDSHTSEMSTFNPFYYRILYVKFYEISHIRIMAKNHNFETFSTF